MARESGGIVVAGPLVIISGVMIATYAVIVRALVVYGREDAAIPGAGGRHGPHSAVPGRVCARPTAKAPPVESLDPGGASAWSVACYLGGSVSSASSSTQSSSSARSVCQAA